MRVRIGSKTISNFPTNEVPEEGRRNFSSEMLKNKQNNVGDPL